VQLRNRQRVVIPVKATILEFGLKIRNKHSESRVRPAFWTASIIWSGFRHDATVDRVRRSVSKSEYRVQAD
jgi:hypothetical protein